MIPVIRVDGIGRCFVDESGCVVWNVLHGCRVDAANPPEMWCFTPVSPQ